MPTFIPPTTSGRRIADPAKRPRSGAHALWYHYGAWETGLTVWRDSQGVWHESLVPYVGGSVHRVFKDGVLISETGPDEGLATAQEVYLGGHVHDITEAKAAELLAAGFSVGGHWDSQEQIWVDYAISSPINAGWKGGDACASLKRPTSPTSLWTFADTLVGTVGADGFYVSGLPFRNSCVARDGTGAVTGQIYAVGVSGPAFQHPTPSTHWWWPLDLTVNGTVDDVNDPTVLAALEVTLGGPFGIGELVQNTLITLNVFAGVTSTVNVPSEDGKFWFHSVFNDTDYHYILGFEQETTEGSVLDTRTYHRLARVPIGSLTTVGLWEYRTATGWSPTQTHAVRIVDAHGSDIEGDMDITKIGSTYVLAAMRINSPQVRLYRSDSPTGPWTAYHSTENEPHASPSQPTLNGIDYGFYQPKFHEWMNPSANTMVLSYARNSFVRVGHVTPAITNIHCSTFCPQFVYLPAP